jgi:HK97 family phage major capsid protein
MIELVPLDALRSVEDLTAHKTDVKTRIDELHAESKGLPFTADQQTEWATLKDRMTETQNRIAELEARHAYIAELAQDDRHVERPAQASTRRTKSRIPENLHDLAAYRVVASSLDELPSLYVDGAKRVVDGLAANTASKDRLHAFLGSSGPERMIDNPGVLAERLLAVSGPLYMRAFGKYLSNSPLTTEERAALATYTNSGADGGYAVPAELDPTLIFTGDGVLNPIRQIARVETITGQEWKGITSGDVTLSRVAENTAVTPASPTLAQPRVVPTAVKGTVDFSIEVGQDWASLQGEMGRALARAKAVEESSSFIVGTGNGITGPEGIDRVADSSIVWTEATGNFGVEDLYNLENDVPPDFIANASFLAAKPIYNLIRRFSVGTVGEGSIWVRGIAAGQPPELLGYPAYVASAMDSTVADGNDIAILGDFSNFIIVDRVGMSVELIPHMFDGDGKPLGKRGLWVMYRNSSAVLVDNAFRKLRVGEGS